MKAYIEERDGFPTDLDDIFLTNGASEGPEKPSPSHCALIEVFVGHKTQDGVAVPNCRSCTGCWTVSAGVKTILNMLVSGPGDGVMIPIPQYPLYSATLTALGAKHYPNRQQQQDTAHTGPGPQRAVVPRSKLCGYQH